MNHTDQKERYLAYRETAKRYWPKDNPIGVHIPEHATVQMVEGGAFVEATVWVSDQHLAVYIEQERHPWKA